MRKNVLLRNQSRIEKTRPKRNSQPIVINKRNLEKKTKINFSVVDKKNGKKHRRTFSMDSTPLLKKNSSKRKKLLKKALRLPPTKKEVLKVEKEDESIIGLTQTNIIEKIKKNKIIQFLIMNISFEKLGAIYQFILFSCIVYNLLSIPYRIGFENETHIVLFILDIIVDCISWSNILYTIFIKENLLWFPFKSMEEDDIANSNSKKKDSDKTPLQKKKKTGMGSLSNFVSFQKQIFAKKIMQSKMSLNKSFKNTFLIKNNQKLWKTTKNLQKGISSYRELAKGKNFIKFRKLVSKEEEKKKKNLIKKLWYTFITKMTLIEIVSLAPLEWIFPSSIQIWGRTIRLLGVIKINEYKESIKKILSEKIVSPVIFKIFYSFFILLIVSHLFTCGWFYIARLDSNYNNFIVPSNVKTPLLYEALVFPGDPNYNILVRAKQYLSSWYFAASYMIGFNNPAPQDTIQSLYSVSVVICGAIFFVIIVGTVSSLLYNINKSNQEFDDEQNQLEAFLNYKDVNTKLKHDIKSYYRALRKTGNAGDTRNDGEVEIFHDLDIAVKKKISKFTKAEAVEKVKLFSECKNEFFIEDICLHLKYLLLLKGYTLIEQGKIGYEMYILISGKVGIYVNGKFITNLGKGSCFGEITLLYPTPRTATVVSTEICEVFVLEKRHFNKILSNYPEYRLYFEKQAKQTIKKNKKIKNEK